MGGAARWKASMRRGGRGIRCAYFYDERCDKALGQGLLQLAMGRQIRLKRLIYPDLSVRHFYAQVREKRRSPLKRNCHIRSQPCTAEIANLCICAVFYQSLIKR